MLATAWFMADHLQAQGGAQTRAQATTPHIILETVGPDGWRTRLGPTNVATMLAYRPDGHMPTDGDCLH